jgi:hypothetical protein
MIVPRKGYEIGDTKDIVLANALAVNAYVISIGDAIQPGATGHAKFATGAASTGLILGIVVGLVYNSKVTEITSLTGVNTASTAAGATPATTLYNDNETTGYWSVQYIPSYIPMEYTADVDAVLDTTTDSGGKVFLGLDGVSSTAGAAGTLLESSVALFGGTAAQFMSFGVAPEFANTTFANKKAIVTIYKQF